MWWWEKWEPTKTPFYILLCFEGLWAICWIVAMFWFILDTFGTLSPTHDMETLRIHLHLMGLHANVPLALVILAYAKEALFGWTPFFWLFFACFVDLALVLVSFLHIHANPAAMTNALYFMRFLSIYALVLAGLASIANAAVWIYIWNGSKKTDAFKKAAKLDDEGEPFLTGFRDSTVVAREESKIFHRVK